jgi:hypothetical protein
MVEDENQADVDAAAAPREDEVAGSFMVFDGKLEDMSKDMRPLHQLKMLSEKYMGTHPMEMFQQNHMEQLRKYVDKSEEFRGEVVFFEKNAFLLKPENMLATDGCVYMNIKSVDLGKYLDHIEEDVNEESRLSIKKSGEFKYFSSESLSGQNLSPKRSTPSKYKQKIQNLDSTGLE